MDDDRALSYLETDKSENVRFYEKFGFTVNAEAKILGIPNWFMSRSPRIISSWVGNLPWTVRCEGHHGTP
jgi:hypothetical protein